MPKQSRPSRTARTLRAALQRRIDSGVSRYRIAHDLSGGVREELVKIDNRLQSFLAGADSQISFVESLADYLGMPLLSRKSTKRVQ